MPAPPPFRPIAFAAALSACAGGGPPPSAPIEVPSHRYSVSMTADFSFSGEGLPPALAATEPWQERWALLVRSQPGRRYRDDSVGEVLVFEQAEVGLEPSGALAPHALEGHAVTLRRFPSGEILAVEDAAHVVGGDRQLEVLDLLLPTLSPKVPVLRRGETVTWNTRWPLDLGPFGKLTGMLRLSWTLDSLTKVDGEPAWALSYTGEWQTRVRTGAGDRRSWTHTDNMGTASGALILSRLDASVLRHDFDWQRDIALPAPGDEAPATVQRQRFVGAVVRQ